MKYCSNTDQILFKYRSNTVQIRQQVVSMNSAKNATYFISINFRILDYNTGHFIDFSPEQSDFSSKCACISSTILTFLPNKKKSQKVHFPQIVPIIQGTLLTFLPKKVTFSSNCTCAYRALFWLFCLIIQCVFTPKNTKNLIFP